MKASPDSISPARLRINIDTTTELGGTVDVLLASYNGERYIGEQIQSIIDQTYMDWRLLISDDCSNDQSLQIAEEMEKLDPRVSTVLKGIKKGSAKDNFWMLLQNTNSKYVMFCDQDDVWSQTKIEVTLNKMQEMELKYGVSTPILVFGDMQVVDEKLEVISNSFEKYSNYNPTKTSAQSIVAMNIAAGCTMMANRRLVTLCKMAQDTSKIIMHDWWVILVASVFGKIGYVDDQLSLYRQHGSNEVGAKKFSIFSKLGTVKSNERSVASTMRQAEYFLEVYGEAMPVNLRNDFRDFVLSGSSPKRLRRLHYLMRSRCLKAGVRKVGQVLAVLHSKLL